MVLELSTGHDNSCLFFMPAVPWPEKSAAPKIKNLGNVYSYLLVVVLQRVVIYASINREHTNSYTKFVVCVVLCQTCQTIRCDTAVHSLFKAEWNNTCHTHQYEIIFVIKNIIIILIKTAQTHMCMVILHELQNKLALMILSHNCFIYFKCSLYVIHFQLIINLLPNFYFKNFDLRKGACKIIKTFVFYYCTILTKNFIFKRKY